MTLPVITILLWSALVAMGKDELRLGGRSHLWHLWSSSLALLFFPQTTFLPDRARHSSSHIMFSLWFCSFIILPIHALHYHATTTTTTTTTPRRPWSSPSLLFFAYLSSSFTLFLTTLSHSIKTGQQSCHTWIGIYNFPFVERIPITTDYYYYCILFNKCHLLDWTPFSSAAGTSFAEAATHTTHFCTPTHQHTHTHTIVHSCHSSIFYFFSTLFSFYFALECVFYMAIATFLSLVSTNKAILLLEQMSFNLCSFSFG